MVGSPTWTPPLAQPQAVPINSQIPTPNNLQNDTPPLMMMTQGQMVQVECVFRCKSATDSDLMSATP
jgi:hypothetical protein